MLQRGVRNCYQCIRPNLLAKQYFGSVITRSKMSTQVEPKEISIPVPFGHLAGKVWNDGGRPVLGLHGWMDNAGTWDTVAPLLPPDVSLVAIDFSNHGRSSRRPLGASSHFLDLILEIERVRQHFQWDQMDLIGHSMGGGAAMMYAATFPERVNKLIMVDLIKPVSVDPSNQPDKTAESIEDLIEAEAKLSSKPPTYDYDAIVQRLVKSYGHSITEESAKILLKRGSKESDNGQYSFTYDPRLKVGSIINLSFEQQKSFAQRVCCDMLIIKATLGPLYEAKELYNEILNIYEKSAKSFSYAKVEGSHHVHLNQPEAVAPLICDFLNKIEITSQSEARL